MEITRKKIAIIFGTRPEAIKLAPVIHELRRSEQFFSLRLITTGQHREMLDDVLSAFSITPDYDLNVTGLRQSLSALTQNILEKLDYVLAVEEPHLVIVQGDSVTTFISALAAFHRRIPVVHIEAGLRTGNRMEPYPEEAYRRLISTVTDLHCTPTMSAAKMLTTEGIAKDAVLCTGNTVIDALQRTVRSGYVFSNKTVTEIIALRKRIVVVTLHRRENIGEPMLRICSALKELSLLHPEVNFLFPVHVDPAVRETVFEMLKGIRNIILMEPLIYPDFINLVASAYAVITDSGGLQEEAPSLGKPVLVLRDVTERTEALKTGTVKLVGTETKNIVKAAHALLKDPKMHKKMISSVHPYGDGKASERIAALLLNYFGFSKKRPKGFRPNVR